MEPKEKHTETPQKEPEASAIPEFALTLHKLLTSSEFAGKVVQWLPDGKAWKLVRWDAMRRQVLPRFFPQLMCEGESSAGSIDAFLWHVTAWGFKEVTEGEHAGAYEHEVR